MAGLRLDNSSGALAKLPSGDTAVVPRDPTHSELVRRIDSGSMPPAYFGKKLTAEQVALLKRWVVEGAPYAKHWAFVTPKRPAAPQVKQRSWVRTPIDSFILSRLEQEGLHPSREAERATLLRRVTLDLTGLPPTPEELRAYAEDTRPDAYERAVDRLLASPHYGERMALAWLDLARYADTNGYHIDNQRDMWLWRDWVIRAFNSDLSYDQFVVQQLAGDLLPNATVDQKVASGFNRNHPITFEGGAIPEEYAAAYVEDRVDATSTTFMGLTMKCAQCHDHKYDPITQKDYYRFFAFFNNVPEQGLDGNNGNAAPMLKVPSDKQRADLAACDSKVTELEKAVRTRADEAPADAARWEKEQAVQLLRPVSDEGLAAHYALDGAIGQKVAPYPGMGPQATLIGKASFGAGRSGRALKLDGSNYVDLGTSIAPERTEPFSYGAWVYPTSGDDGAVVSRMDDSQAFRGWDLYLTGGKVFVHLIHEWEKNAIRVTSKSALPMNQWHHLFVTYDGSSKAKGLRLYVDGKAAEVDVTHDTLTDSIIANKPVLIGRRNPAAPFKGMVQELRIYRRELTADEVARLAGMDVLRPILALPPDQRTKAQREALTSYYLQNVDEPYRKATADLEEMRKRRAEVDSSIPTTMVMQEMDRPRDTVVLLRGQYDQRGEKVYPGTPAVLPPMRAETPTNRLRLARWLVDPQHPLTARVAVNRYWEMLFGTGLVKTSENFGTQGEAPSHPELLDWLATEFVRTGWDVKAMLRLIVTSSTYRQASHATQSLLKRDPENRLLARGPRVRLPAEVVRDQALAVSGLLVDKQGGPSVKPYQPQGLWKEISFGSGFTAQDYVQDHGEALYRRSMYTFWKRTCPPPSLQTFDAPEREFCMVRRSVTNTPLQALVLLNDPTYLEASRKLAERMLTSPAATDQDRLRDEFCLVLCREPTFRERNLFLDILKSQRARLSRDPDAARKLLSVGESPRNEKLPPAELAAWSVLSSMLLNLDETITKS
jgi:hypothetical protein